MKRIYFDNFFGEQPFKLDSVVNQHNQVVDFYEHPTRGDTSTVLAVIDGKVFETDFWGTEDFFIESDYNPILIGEECVCFFETVN